MIGGLGRERPLGHGRHVGDGNHHVGRRATIEPARHLRGRAFRRRRAEQEPAHEARPQRVRVTARDHHRRERDHEHAEPATDARGDDLRLATILAPRPDDRREDATPVERRTRQQVEDGEHDVHHAQPRRHDGQQTAGRLHRVQPVRQREERAAEHHARRRSDRRDLQLRLRARSFVLQAGDAAEQPQRDALDLLAVALRDERVRELVGEDRREEQDGAEDPRREVGAVRVGGHGREQRARERADDHHRDDEQAPVDAYLDPADAAQANRGSHRGPLFPVEAFVVQRQQGLSRS